MKNFEKFVRLPFLFIAFLLMLTTACKKDDVKPDDEEPPVVVEYEKKGAAFTTNGFTWNKYVVGIKPFWHYSWSSDLSVIEPDNVEFVPMVWGKGFDDQNVAALKQLADEGKIKFLLGFNEPDGEEQANMTVDEAIALWPKMEEVGVPLGSPATVNPLNDWMKEFMSKASAQGLRIDFVCVHSYGGASFTSLKEKLESTYNEYGKPIWITEFAVADWNASSPAENKYSPSQVLDFMKTALPALDKMEIIERYSWFSAKTTNPALTSSALYDENDNLTVLGRFYANHTPNDETGPALDPVIYPNIEGNLIPNGNFGDYHIYGNPDEKAPQSVAWFGYQFGVEVNDVVKGWAARMLNGWSGNSAFSNVFPVEAGKTYEISFYAKWLGDSGSISMTFKDRDAIIAWEAAGKPDDSKPPILASSPSIDADVDENNEWTQVSFEYTAPDGVANIQLSLWKPDGSSQLLIDEVLAKEKI